MFGWTRRYLQVRRPIYVPPSLLSIWQKDAPIRSEKKWLFIAFFTVCFGIIFCRMLEIPFWQHPSQKFAGEYLLATHDAYHWVAGAEGFSFGTGHPMAVFLSKLSSFLDLPVAVVAFWCPIALGALTGIAVFLWATLLGFPFAGICAAFLASLTPSFFCRSLLGFYDTDLFILPFAIILGLIPAIWIHPWLTTFPDIALGFFRRKQRAQSVQTEKQSPFFDTTIPSCTALECLPKKFAQDLLSYPWLLLLIFSGYFGYWTQEWHSMFPYLIRYIALVLPLLIIILGPAQGRQLLLQGGLCFAVPLISGKIGVAFALLYSICIRMGYYPLRSEASEEVPFLEKIFTRCAQEVAWLCNHPFTATALWSGVVFLCIDGAVIEQLMASYKAYADRAGETTAVAKDVLFPSVNQSIIEIQTISFTELFSFLYPNMFFSFFCLLAFLLLLLLFPVVLFLLPLVVLFFASPYMGGRMSMYGAPILVLSGSIVLFLLIGYLGQLFLYIKRMWRKYIDSKNEIKKENITPFLSFLGTLVLTAFLVYPLISLIPYASQGSIIAAEHAQALSYIKNNTPNNAVVWNWWDWGYATHHFAQRKTIADGARHNGPALYLPAVVYSTSNPRLARQLIKHVATQGNNPNAIFAGMSAEEAQRLIHTLADPDTPLLQTPDKQYIVVTLELVRLGEWITNFGTWNFVEQKGSPAGVWSFLRGVEFDSETGFLYEPGSEEYIPAASVSLFTEKKLSWFEYPKNEGGHFLFLVKELNQASLVTSFSYFSRFWKILQKESFYKSSSYEKLVIDDAMYHTMMVQLLLSSPDNPNIRPYFKCIFDNVFARVYEVL